MQRAFAPPPSASRARLVWFLLFYGIFILAGSLYPFSGWTGLDDSPLHFLTAPWPRYITRTDLATNLLSYAPLGYAFALWFSSPGHRLRGVILGIMAGILLSFLCETLQQFLPSRITSNLDLLVNSLGALLGALLSLHHNRWLRAGHAVNRWRGRWFRADLLTSLGLMLLALWFIAQFALVPVAGIGWLHLHLRPLDLPPPSLEGINIPWLLALFSEMVAVGAFAGNLLRPGRYVGGLTVLFLAAFVGKLLAATVLLKLAVVGGVLSLETLAAFVLAFWLLLLPAVSRHRFGVAMAGMVLLILARLSLAEDFLPRTSFLNIVGLAKHLGALWPILGVGWLAAIHAEKKPPPRP
jgi:VanZ family protein